jgi:uncharacterized protein YqgV (UPF0045/DUF77 family)
MTDEGIKMGTIAAQVSLYPLRQASIGPPIREAVRVFRQHGLETRIGEMSTLVWGEEGVLFAALQEAFRQAAACGDAVMVVTLSNACPGPEEA